MAAARKPIRFQDMHHPDAVARAYESTRGMATRTGQVPVTITCPFCAGTVRTWLWSLSGGGKRCAGCRAIFGSGGTGYQWRDQIPGDATNDPYGIGPRPESIELRRLDPDDLAPADLFDHLEPELPPICEECGNDHAAEGELKCTDCLSGT